VSEAAGVVLWLDEQSLLTVPPLALRCVVYVGGIDTAINPERAHGMLGEGFAAAHAELVQLKKRRARFAIKTGKKRVDEELNLAFSIHAGLRDAWAERDYPVAAALIEAADYRQAASRLGLHPSSAFRRQRTLRTRLYRQTSELIGLLAQAD
jgi:hypothetical protein